MHRTDQNPDQTDDSKKSATSISESLSSIHNNLSDILTGNDFIKDSIPDEILSIKNYGGKKARCLLDKHKHHLGLGSANQLKNRKGLREWQQAHALTEGLGKTIGYMDTGLEVIEQVYKFGNNIKQEGTYSNTAIATEGILRLGEFAVNTVVSGGVCNFIARGMLTGALVAESGIVMPLLLSIIVTNSVRNYVITPWELMKTSQKIVAGTIFTEIKITHPVQQACSMIHQLVQPAAYRR